MRIDSLELVLPELALFGNHCPIKKLEKDEWESDEEKERKNNLKNSEWLDYQLAKDLSLEPLDAGELAQCQDQPSLTIKPDVG